MRPERSLFTILFTDIVGSTERAAALGDRLWRDLLARHQVVVRQEIKRFRGREVATAGDGFLAVFDEPAPAIFCGVAMRDAVREMGLEIRCGLHMGSIEWSADDVAGIGVHIAARVMSQAAPGEVLVSRTVRDAESGSEFGFKESGSHELKGVPGEWQLFRVTSVPSGLDGLTAGRRQKSLTIDRRVLLGAAFAGLLLLGGFFVIRRDAGPDLTPEEARAAAAPAIAIVPFRIGDPDLEQWREGMIDLLSTNLDGAGGLRAIDSRTILARWREGTAEGGDPDLSATLDIAGRTGAVYAIVGTVLMVGPAIRLSADIYDLESRVSLGEVQAEGLPDSISGVIDKLSIEIIRTILPSDTKRLPSLRLAGITTTSVPALKAYLEAEALYRRGAYVEAVNAYERAIVVDSTFALAHFGLAESCSAEFYCDWSKARSSYERAYRFVDRLPERDALLVRARQAFIASNPYLAREILQQAVQTYPDDAMAWNFLSEVYVHYGGQIMAEDMGTWKVLMERSVRLDPSNAIYLYHLVEDAIANGDSARARSLTQSYARVAGTDPRSRSVSLAFTLVFGDPASNARAMAATDTIGTGVLEIGTRVFFGHPASTAVVETLLRKITGRADADDFDMMLLFHTLVSQGKLRAAKETDMDFSTLSGDARGFSAYLLHKYHELPGEDAVTDAMLEEILSIADSDTLAWFYAGSHAAERGRWDEHRDAMERLRREGRIVAASGDTTRGRVLRGAADALEGFGLWRQGRPRDALARLEQARKEVVSYHLEGFWNDTIRYWLATLLLELDRPEEAARYFESLWNQHYTFYREPYTTYELAKLWDRLGREHEAIEAYEYVIAGLRNGDSEVQPLVDEARRAITRLSGANQ